MNEIKVYHSVWKKAITILLDLLLVALGVSVIMSDSLKGGYLVLAWFLVVFFCLGALIAAYPLIKQGITKEPYLTITDDSVKVAERKRLEIRYADVESFVRKRAPVECVIVVNYKNEKATPGAILASDLTVGPKELLAFLNERLSAHKR